MICTLERTRDQHFTSINAKLGVVIVLLKAFDIQKWNKRTSGSFNPKKPAIISLLRMTALFLWNIKCYNFLFKTMVFLKLVLMAYTARVLICQAHITILSAYSLWQGGEETGCPRRQTVSAKQPPLQDLSLKKWSRGRITTPYSQPIVLCAKHWLVPLAE